MTNQTKVTSHRKTKIGAAVTAASRAQTGTIAIEGGKGGIVTAIELTAWGTQETIVNSGGLVELENDAIDWKPFEFYVGGNTCVTEGGGNLDPLRIPVHKKLPANSTVTIWYTPQDNQSQKLSVVLFWETNLSYRGVQTYAKSGIGSAITQVTIAAAHTTIEIPAEKGGAVKAFQVMVWGTLETVVNSGGLVAIDNNTDSYKPFEFYTNGITVVDAGGANIAPYMMPANLPAKARSIISVDYTPQDNQSQKISVVAIWEG